MSPNPPGEQPLTRRRTLQGRLDLSSAELRLLKRSGFELPHIAGWETFGPIGMPALPQQLGYAVLPAGAKLLGIDVAPGAPVVVPGPVNAYPVQPPFSTPRALAEPPIVPLARSLAVQGARYPRELVVAGEPRVRDGLQLIPLRIRVVQYDPPRQTFVFYPGLQLTVQYESSAETGVYVRPRWLDKLAAATLLLIPEDLFAERTIRSVATDARAISIPYVIITDDTFWPESIQEAGETRPPKDTEAGPTIGLEGTGGNLQDGPVAHFERLAQWKTSRRMRTRVVTIKDILANKYGDCTENSYARDLQEVIRNFIIRAHRDWDTEYVLLGGHPRIVPIRSFLGHITCSGSYPGWDFYKYPKTTTIEGGGPPPRGRMYCDNHTLLCHDSGLGQPKTDTPLVTAAGRVIPFKSTSNATLGWYFEGKNFDSGPLNRPKWWKCPGHYGDTPEGKNICNILVEGPKTIIDDDMHWALPERLVPSDVYYAALRPTSDQNGRHHAFDRNGNGFYGEYKWNETEQGETGIDGMETILADVKVGRAPVLSGKEAQHFVDKVLAYETLVNVDGEALDPQYLTRKLVVADIWRSGDHLAKHRPCWSDRAAPAAGEFVKPSGEPAVIVHLQPNIEAALKCQQAARTRLVARFNAVWGGTDVPVTKRGATADATKDTWRFVKRRGGGFVASDTASDYVELTGPAFENKPECILWYYSAADSCDDATTQAEELVDDGFNRFSEFSTERCLIETYAAPAAAIPLNAATIRAALDHGPHLVGVYGHGSENGLSYIYWHDNDAASRELRNADRPFIMYANSCLTANPGHSFRSLGEFMVTHRNGAVAYVGYTQTGFQEGHLQQQRFFKGLYTYGRLGRAAQVSGAETTWQVYEQILYGDPEMPVWNRRPRRYLVIHPEQVDRTVNLMKVIVLARDGGAALKGQRVTLMAGWHGSAEGPEFLTWGDTGDDGVAELDMTGRPESQATVSLTVVPADPAGERGAYVPYSVRLPVYGYQRGWRRCRHCQTLFLLNDLGSSCPRPGGGFHDAAQGEEYRVIANTPATAESIQQGWRWCRSCQALHFPGAGETCHSPGGHIDSGSGEYAVEIIASPDKEKPAWRFCNKCRVLHLVRNGTTGPCFGGDAHTIDGSCYRVQRA